MMTSMARAAEGHLFYLALGPALLGAAIHMMIGAMYGAVFASVAGLLRLRGPMLVVAGAVWGGVAFVTSSFVALPVAASLLGSGDQIARMASMVGYGTFLAEHLVFGVALGLLLARTGAAAR